MTGEEYRALLKRRGLRQADGAWLCDQCLRASTKWVLNGPSPPAALLLQAYDEGALGIDWFAQHVTRPIPK